MADVVSVVIAAFSGVAGAAVGGFFTNRVARQQADMTQKLRRMEWERADTVARRDRYAQFTAAASQMMDYWLRPPVVRDSADLDEKRDIAQRSFDRLSDTVLMTASADTKKAAEKILKAVEETKQVVRQQPPSGGPRLQELQRIFDQARMDFIEVIRVRTPWLGGPLPPG